VVIELTYSDRLIPTCPSCKFPTVARVAGQWCPRCRGWRITERDALTGDVVVRLWRKLA
jgi:ribosomal protein L37AE/L43A